jgi:hypothetical protein
VAGSAAIHFPVTVDQALTGTCYGADVAHTGFGETEEPGWSLWDFLALGLATSV